MARTVGRLLRTSGACGIVSGYEDSIPSHRDNLLALPRRLWSEPDSSERSGKGHFDANQPTQRAAGRGVDADSPEGCEANSATPCGRGEGESDRQFWESGYRGRRRPRHTAGGRVYHGAGVEGFSEQPHLFHVGAVGALRASGSIVGQPALPGRLGEAGGGGSAPSKPRIRAPRSEGRRMDLHATARQSGAGELLGYLVPALPQGD